MPDQPLAPSPGDVPPPADIVIGSDTSMMDGVTLRYRYTSGRDYKLEFTAATVTFTMLDAPDFKPQFGAPISVPYLARQVRDQLVLIHWLVPDRSGHISLLIDFAAATLFVSALMPFKMEFFDTAVIYDVAGWRG